MDTSSEEIFSGDLHKISKGHSQERHFILFDHQLVYCKRVSSLNNCCTFCWEYLAVYIVRSVQHGYFAFIVLKKTVSSYLYCNFMRV